jgi:hypothetical protein
MSFRASRAPDDLRKRAEADIDAWLADPADGPVVGVNALRD